MSLDKAIAHGKEHRKPYRGCKAVDSTCRNHGSCPACAKARVVKWKKRLPAEDTGEEPEEPCLSDLELEMSTEAFIEVLSGL